MQFELDVKALRYFVAVATRGSFSLAAAHLRITQPAVSRQIQAIERAYQTRLFRRDGRQFVLTEAGQVLFEQACAIVERLDAVENAVRSASREPAGRLTVGATTAVAEALLPTVIQRYRARYPRVFIHVVQAESSELKELLTGGVLDVALLYGEPRPGESSLLPLVDLHLGLVAPPAPGARRKDPIGERSDITLAEAAALPLIFPARGHALRKRIEAACTQIGATPNVVLESQSHLLSKALVRAGVGYMLVGNLGVHEEVNSGALRFVPLVQPGITWRMSVTVRGSKIPGLAAQKFVQEVKDGVRRSVHDRAWLGDLLV